MIAGQIKDAGQVTWVESDLGTSMSKHVNIFLATIKNFKHPGWNGFMMHLDTCLIGNRDMDHP